MRLRSALLGALTASVLSVAGLSVAQATGDGKPHDPHDHHRILICHKGKHITIDDSAWPAHEKHGDNKGLCKPKPTEQPTEEPTDEPSEEPTDEPTDQPTDEPTDEPTEEPTEEPSEVPTQEPTERPSEEPSESPSEEPTTPVKPDTDEPKKNNTPKKDSKPKKDSSDDLPPITDDDRNGDGVPDKNRENLIEEGF
jgi:outer membrane biosynthesis protein TonB